MVIDGDVMESVRRVGSEPGESVMPIDCRQRRRME